jgi:hypothetical protein
MKKKGNREYNKESIFLSEREAMKTQKSLMNRMERILGRQQSRKF